MFILEWFFKDFFFVNIFLHKGLKIVIPNFCNNISNLLIQIFFWSRSYLSKRMVYIIYEFIWYFDGYIFLNFVHLPSKFFGRKTKCIQFIFAKWDCLVHCDLCTKMKKREKNPARLPHHSFKICSSSNDVILNENWAV